MRVFTFETNSSERISAGSSN